MAEANPFPFCISKSPFEQDCMPCSEAAGQGLWDAPVHLHTALQTTTEHRELLHSTSFSCLPAFGQPHYFWRDFRAKIVTVLLRKKTQWITATSPVLNPVAAVMVFHGLTSLKKQTQPLKARASSSSGGRQSPEDTLLLCATDHWAREGTSQDSFFLPVYPCFISLIHPKSKDVLFKICTSSSSLLPGSCCSVLLEERAALMASYGSRLPKSRQIIQRETVCFQVSTHGNKQAKWREKQNFYFF